MSHANDSDTELALNELEAKLTNLSAQDRGAVMSAVADLLEAIITPPVWVERRPNAPTQPSVQQIQTLVNRLRDKAKP